MAISQYDTGLTNFVSGVLDLFSRRCAEQRISKNEPQPCVRVQQQIHCMYSPKSLRCSSSSETTVSIPRQLPNTGCP